MDLAEWLLEVQAREGLSEPLRQEAARMSDLLQQGVLPSLKAIERLRRTLTPPGPCAKLEHDGACVWLRRNPGEIMLPVAPVGERAMCPFEETKQADCPGYRRRRP